MRIKPVFIILIAFVFTIGCGKKSEEKKETAKMSNMKESDTDGQSNRLLSETPAAKRSNYYSSEPEMTIDQAKKYTAAVHTSKGDIVMELDAFYAPSHTNNFVFLARQGFYDGLTFHRVEPNFVIQGGDPLGRGNGGPGYTIPAEISLPHLQGVVAMARTPDQINPERRSSGSQFYITLQPTQFLDGQYSVFGKVVSGFEVVQQIAIGDLITSVDIEEK